VADELWAKAIVLENDGTSIAIVVCDVIAAEKHDLDRAKDRAAELTGISPDHIFISCTHTHSGPATLDILGVEREDEYMDWAVKKIGDAVKLAQNRLQPASFAHNSGSCPEEVHNRRWHMTDGSVRMNPGFENPELVRPAGPIDPEVAVGVFIDENRRPIAALCNYALHYVGGPYGMASSANYFGYFDRALQRMGGDEFVAIMANGTCGDINNCDFTRPAPEYPHPFFQIERVANVVASRAFGAWQTIWDYSRDVALGAETEMIDFRRREATEEQLQWATENIEKEGEIEHKDYIYAREILAVEEEAVTRPTPIMGLRVGDLGIVGLPGEIFVQYGLQIKAKSPFERTMTISLANDAVGYCPTDLALEEGSYETELARSAKAAPGTEGQMVNAAVDVLKRLAK
ncbi:MAG: hypothetical protein R6V19_09260, partial [Armatimonadota bacterium]